MSILDSDLQAFLPASVSNDPASNGGRMSNKSISLNAKNNVFPDVSRAQRTSGATRWRKLFLANRNVENLAVQSTFVVLDKPTVYGDFALFRPGTHEDFESAISGATYGCALLAQDAAAGATTLTLALEAASLSAMLAAGREILVTARADFKSSSGAEEFAQIASVSTSGLQATVTLSAALANAYTVAAGARVCTVYRPAQPATPALTDWTESGSGSYDRANFPVVLTNVGTIRQAWTITYQSATSFTVSGDVLGVLGTFETSADAAPAPAGGEPYFRLRSGGHGTGHANGDTITFTTSPAAVPIWVQSAIPTGLDEFGMSDIPISWSVEGET